jgi:asparagine synthase (glutamine-hydrolysing)
MCGIVGIFDRRGAIEQETLKNMVSILRHRGPDFQKIWVNGKKTVGLGQSRLAILDTSESGNAPMLSPDGRVAITYNGEVYNFRRIREELEAKGHRFRSQSDTEVILKAYLQWGIECVKRFVGMFAIAIWDEDRQTLYLLRDRLGIKPLYYLALPGYIAFASEIKALLKLPQFSKDISPPALLAYLRFQYVPAPYSIFKAVKKLLPGHILSFDGRELAVKRYWQIPLRRGIDERKTNDEVEEGFLELLRGAVRSELISDVPLGGFLSGGIDSSLVTALMQEQGNTVAKTFTVGFDRPEYDEAPYAKKVAQYLGTEHTEMRISASDLLPIISRLPDCYDEPFGDPSALPTFMLSQMTRKYVTVALSGDGGDELFCGYDRYFWLKLMHGLSNLPEAMLYSLSYPVGFLFRDWGDSLKRLAREKDIAETYLRAVSIFDAHHLQDIVQKDWLAAVEKARDEYRRQFLQMLKHRNYIESAMLVDLNTYLVDDLLVKVDRASMANSLEVRVPLLDHRVVERACELGLEWKARGWKGKLLLRRLLGRYLPRKLFERPKKGFAVPLADWLRQELGDTLQQYLGEGRLTGDEILSPAGVRRLIDEHKSFVRDHHHRLWILLVLQMWREKYGL